MLLLNRGLRILKSKQYYGHNPNPWNSRICLILLPAPWMTLMCYNIVQNRTYPLPPSQTPDFQTFPCRYSFQCLVHTSSGIPGRLVNRKEWWGNSYCYIHGRCRKTFSDAGIMILEKQKSSGGRRWVLTRTQVRLAASTQDGIKLWLIRSHFILTGCIQFLWCINAEAQHSGF